MAVNQIRSDVNKEQALALIQSNRLADACALMVGLPIGTGEIDWTTALTDVDAPEGTLTIASHASPREVQRSAEFVLARR